MSFNDKSLEELFALANKAGSRRYNRLTQKDFEDYRQFDFWRYVNGDSECGTTPESKKWVKDNSDWNCPICEKKFSQVGGRTIDHKLARSQYPWLSMDFRNLWVICHSCNQEKGEMNWYEYEHYMLVNHPARYENIQVFRPRQLLKLLKT